MSSVCGGGFLPLKSILFDGGRKGLACENADKARVIAELSYKEYELAKGTSRETEKAEELSKNTKIMQGSSETCSEIDSSLFRTKLVIAIFD